MKLSSFISYMREKVVGYLEDWNWHMHFGKIMAGEKIQLYSGYGLKHETIFKRKREYQIQ